MSVFKYISVFICFLIVSISNAADWKTVNIGMDEDYPPYEFVDEKGQPSGMLVDLSRAVGDVMGFDVEFVTGDWPKTMSDIYSGRTDILQGFSWSEKRAERFAFTPHIVLVNHAIFARKGTPPVSSLEELAGKEVIVHNGGAMHEQLSRLPVPPKLILTGTPDDVLRLLASGKHDYAVVALLPGTYIIKKHKLTNLVPVAKSVAVFRFGYASLRENSDIAARFAEGVAILKQTGEYDRIKEKWLGVMDDSFISWTTLLKYFLLTSVPGLAVFGTVLLWSYSLKSKVNERTASLSKAIDELQKNQRQLMQADKMATLGILVSGVAHEINNPNGLILLNTPIIQRSFSDITSILDDYYAEHGDFPVGGIQYSKMREQLPQIINETNAGAQRIKRIVNDLKNFARRDDAGEKAVFDLNDCLASALRLIDAEIKKKTNRFTVKYSPVPVNIYGNVQRIEQVAVNLLVNACQALKSSDKAITAEIINNGSDAVLIVSDEGTGIKPDELNMVTDPFFTTKRDSGGTGLGLSVSEGIIKDHGGTMRFESVYGNGTTVTITFPQHKRSEA